MTTTHINIAQQFSRFPAGRFEADGPYSGEGCRRHLLAPALRNFDRVEVDLNGTLGYGSSFLEEAFGGLVRVEGFTPQMVRERLFLIAADDALVDEIWSYITDAQARQVG